MEKSGGLSENEQIAGEVAQTFKKPWLPMITFIGKATGRDWLAFAAGVALTSAVAMFGMRDGTFDGVATVVLVVLAVAAFTAWGKRQHWELLETVRRAQDRVDDRKWPLAKIASERLDCATRDIYFRPAGVGEKARVTAEIRFYLAVPFQIDVRLGDLTWFLDNTPLGRASPRTDMKALPGGKSPEVYYDMELEPVEAAKVQNAVAQSRDVLLRGNLSVDVVRGDEKYKQPFNLLGRVHLQ